MNGSRFVYLHLDAQEKRSGEKLARRASEGSGEAFEALMVLYHESVLACCRRLAVKSEDPEELACDVLSAVCVGFPKWNGRASFHTWACRVAYTTICKTRAKSGNEPVGLSTVGNGSITSALLSWPSKPTVEAEELRVTIREFIDALPIHEREIFEMRLSGHRTEEIATYKEVASGTVRSTLTRVYRKLRDCLKG